MKTYERYMCVLISMIIIIITVYNIPNLSAKNSESICQTSFIAGVPSYEFRYKEKEPIVKEEEILAMVEVEVVEEIEVITKSTLTYSAIDTSNQSVLESYTGTMSAYGADCYGCSGKTASGYDVTVNTYYKDATYGTIRIAAGDSKYPFGTIVRITSTTSNQPIIAIILDRGGGIGFGKQFQYDLLVESESASYEVGVQYNTKFEILRLGY